jgi:RND family efflux transporter MFP subunit
VTQPVQQGLPSRWNWKKWALTAVLGICPVVGGVACLGRADESARTDLAQSTAEQPAGVRVDVIHPDKGKMARTVHQPGSVLSFDYARLYAEVSGYLRTENVDIGDHVTRGQVLIELDVPDRVAQLEQAKASVGLADARLDSAKADLKAAEAKVVQANATARSARAWRTFREKQFKRMQELFASKSIDERLVDESQDQMEAAAETERSGRAGIDTAEAEKEAANARIKQAEADVAVAVANQKKAQVMVDFATLRAPYDGYITQRSKLPGDFVKAADDGSEGTPLLTVERTDKMRVVVQVPDPEVPYCHPGEDAVVEIDALPGKKFNAKVARIARSEDPQTKLMHVEIDVPNPAGEIRQGMYGWVTILLDKQSDQLSVPTSCLVGKSQDGKATLWVVREGRARLIPVRLGSDDGDRVAVQSGLGDRDQVIVQPPPGLEDGTRVVVDGH